MKLQYWVTVAAVSALWGPACVLAQGVHGVQSGLPSAIPHSSVNRLVSVGKFLPHFDPTIPNRRVPSVTSPQSGDIHPVTPDKAWPMPLPSIKPAHLSVKSDMGNIVDGDALSSKGRLRVEEPLESLMGADSPLGQ